MGLDKKTVLRERRKMRYREKNRGTAERPRLAVFRSNNHLSAQVINDAEGRTICQVSTLQKAVAEGLKSTCDIAAAKRVGAKVAEAAKSAGVVTVVFDKGGYLYTGRVKALADAAREAGLKF